MSGVLRYFKEDRYEMKNASDKNAHDNLSSVQRTFGDTMDKGLSRETHGYYTGIPYKKGGKVLLFYFCFNSCAYFFLQHHGQTHHKVVSHLYLLLQSLLNEPLRFPS